MKRLTSLVCAALLVPALAVAQPKTADDYYKDGETQYNLGNFDKAVEAFKQGFAVEANDSKKSAYLYNIAQSYRHGEGLQQRAVLLQALPRAQGQRHQEAAQAREAARDRRSHQRARRLRQAARGDQAKAARCEPAPRRAPASDKPAGDKTAGDKTAGDKGQRVGDAKSADGDGDGDGEEGEEASPRPRPLSPSCSRCVSSVVRPSSRPAISTSPCRRRSRCSVATRSRSTTSSRSTSAPASRSRPCRTTTWIGSRRLGEA